jgi:hypothetical protein
VQVVRRVDQEIQKGNVDITNAAFAFAEVVEGLSYLSTVARRYKTEPMVTELTSALDDFPRENTAVRALVSYASLIPEDLLSPYVSGLTKTYVGRIGSSGRWARTDFYADGAALHIPDMFKSFDDAAAHAFVDGIKTSDLLKRRIQSPAKMRRLRALGNIVLEKASQGFSEKKFLEALCDEAREGEFFDLLK